MNEINKSTDKSPQMSIEREKETHWDTFSFAHIFSLLWHSSNN